MRARLEWRVWNGFWIEDCRSLWPGTKACAFKEQSLVMSMPRGVHDRIFRHRKEIRHCPVRPDTLGEAQWPYVNSGFFDLTDQTGAVMLRIRTSAR